MKSFLAFLAGLGAAYGLSLFAEKGRGQAAKAGLVDLDLNSASAEQLQALGIDEANANRIVENRPYRSKFDLVNRYVVGRPVYDLIKQHVTVAEALSNEPVRVAR